MRGKRPRACRTLARGSSARIFEGFFFFFGALEPASDGCDGGQGRAAGRHLPQQKQAEGREQDVYQPHADDDGQFFLSGQGGSGGRQEVVDEDQQHREDEARSFAATPGSEAQGDADEHEDEAGRGKREPLLQFDEVGASLRFVTARP